MRVLIPDDWNGTFAKAPEVEQLRKRADVVVLGQRTPALWEELRKADVVAGLRERTKFDARQLNDMPQLKMIAQIGGAETPHIDVPTATKNGVIICYTAGAPGARPPIGPGEALASMVEVTIGMIIAAMRQFGQQDRIIHGGGWPGPTGRIMYGKTLGIVGLGRLGTGVAKAAQFFGMRVIAAGRTLTPERAAAAGVEFTSLETLFSEADAVSIHVKLNASTRGMIGADLLRRMKPEAVLINTSRGPLVDEAALVETLRSGRIAGAALDVYDEEPLQPDNPLRSCDNALLLGHCGWPTDSGFASMIPQTVALINAYLDGAPINIANPEARASAKPA